jgi:hypothetical protein
MKIPTVPDFFHKQVRKLAEKVSALLTEEYIAKRAERGNRDKFEAAMAKVAETEPEEYDRL